MSPHRHILLTLILVVAGFAHAGQLQPIEVSNPVNPAQVRGQCLDAFDEAYADKIDYESQPQINLKCAFNMIGNRASSMRDYFLKACASMIDSKSSSSGATVQIAEDKLSGLFDTVYGTVLRKSECFQGAITDFAVAQDQQSGSSGGSPAAASRDGCYAFSGCQQ